MSAGTVNFSDAFGNSITGFESIKFSDITLDALETLTITGPAAPVPIAEGSVAAYDIGLASALNGGNGLQTGQSIAFNLKISNGTDANPANISTDLGAITSDLLTAASGLVLRSVNVDAGSGLIRVLASAATTIAAGSRIATLTLPVIADLLAETDESFGVTLKDFVQTVAITSTISNVAPATIRLVDISPTPGTALEGASASYAVELDGVGLAVGRAVTITLDSSSGTATEAVDFPALIAARLTAATGVTLGTPTVDPTTGAVTITLTNTGATALPAGARLLTFQMPISVDTAVEGDETYTVSLTSTTAAVSAGLITSTIRDLVPTPIISLSGQSTVSEGLSAAYAVSLIGGGLLPGQSFSLTLAAASGTATDVNDFVALLLEGALVAGEGITLGKVSVDPATKAASLSVTNSSQKALAIGAQLLGFNVATIADSAVEANETYNINLSSSTATVTTGTVTTTITDVAPSTQPPAGTPPTINSFDSISGPINGVNLGLTSFGYAIRQASGSTIQIKLSGRFVSPTNPGAGWSAIAAAPESAGTGYELFWKNSDTRQYVRWVLDASGNYSSGALLSTSELLAAESRLNTDLNRDNITGIGVLSTVTSTINGLSLGNTYFGYALQSGANSAIPISLFGQLVSDSNPGDGWRTIAAASSGTGYDLYWRNTLGGQFVRWNLNSNGAYTSGGLLSNLELLSAESSIGFDLTGNGIGVI